MGATLEIALLLATVALLWSTLLTVQAYEHRRYARAALKKPPRPWIQSPRVLVCVPCKGIDLELKGNLRCVLTQSYPNYQVRFVVESAADPACTTIRELMAMAKVPCEMIVAGPCTDSGQKVHNLIAATADLPDEIEVLAFFDSDARPAPHALDYLVNRVYRSPRLQVATGYRWLVPRRANLAGLALASANASLAGLMSQRGLNLVWGGTWAISRAVFEKTALTEAWRGTLSDDLVASRVMRWAGVKLAFEPGCMVASPVDVNWRGAVAFLRRQFLIGRCYSPVWWWCAIPLLILQFAVLFGGLVWGGYMAMQHMENWYAPLAVSGTLYALASLRAHWRQKIWSAKLGLEDSSEQMQAAARFDRWASPVTAFLAVPAMLASAIGNKIVWRGIHYHIGAAGRVTLLGRVPNREEFGSMLWRQRRRTKKDRSQYIAQFGTPADRKRAAAEKAARHHRSKSPPLPKRVA